jgi:hemerythrin
MGQIEWDDSLSVAIDLIDDQHKMLIERLNDLSAAVEMTKGTSEILKTLGFLIDYTDYHFSAEVGYMKKHNYPGLDAHLKQHEIFEASLKNLVTDFEEEGATEALSASINTLLVNWLVNHIKVVDVLFGTFLREQGLENLEG